MKTLVTTLTISLFFSIGIIAQPVITGVTVAPGTYKIGDDVSLTVTTTGDTPTGIGATSTVNGVLPINFSGTGPYTIVYKVASGNTNRASVGDIPLNIVLTSASGNSVAYTTPPTSGGAVTIDANAPTAPSAAPTAAAGPLINASENGTFSIVVGSLTSTGAVAGDVLEILVDGASFATPRVRTLIAGDITSGFTFTNVTLPAPDGAKNITARVTDQAGNVGASSAQLALTLDTSAPTAPSAAPTAAAGPLINASENGAFDIVVGSLTSTGAVAGDVLEILVDGASFATPRVQTLTAGDITSGFTFTNVTLPAPDGAKNITARVTDQAGNVGASSAQLALTSDTSAPAAFTTGTVTITGGTEVAGFWNSTNTGATVTVPLSATDASLDDGTVIIQGRISTGTFGALSPAATSTITTSERTASTKTINLTAAQVESITSFAEGATIQFRAIVRDLAGNETTGAQSLNTFVVDQIAPTITSIARSGATPTNATSVNFTVTFSEPVQATTVTSADFTFVPTGVTGASITSVSPTTGNATVFTVAVNTGTGDGTLGLNWLAAGSATDVPGNVYAAGAVTGAVYTIDKTAPTVVLSDNQTNNFVRSGESVVFTATFTEAIGIDESAGILPRITLSGASGVTNVAMTKSTNLIWTYTWAVPTGDFTSNVSIAAADEAGNTNTPVTGTRTSFIIDNTQPTVVLTDNQLNNLVRSGESVVFTATFTEANGIDESAGILPRITLSGASGVTNVAMTKSTNLIWTYTWNVPAGNFTSTISIAAADVAGNANTAVTGTRTSFILDDTPPVITSIETSSTLRSFGDRAIVPPGGNVEFRVTFTETNVPLSGIDANDFPVGAISTDGSVTFGARTVAATADPRVWTVTITGISGTGRLSLGLTDDDTILDAAGNPLGGTGLGNGTLAPAFTGLRYYTIVLPEPTNPVAALTAPTTTTTSITVQWNQPGGAQAATHYLVMGKPTTTGTFPATVVDGTFVTDAAFIQNVERTAGTQTATFNGLNSGVSYDFIIYPYTRPTNISGNNIDFNVTTPATVTAETNVASTSTLALTSTAVPVGSLKNAAGDAVSVLTYNLTDDGLTPAADNAPFKFTQLVVNNANAVDWTQVLAGAVLTDGTNTATIDFSITPGALTATTITFSSISSAVGGLGHVADNAVKGYTLRVWLKNPLAVADNTLLSFTANNSSFTYDNTSSNQISSKLNTGQSVNSGNNTVTVVATALRFITQPVPTSHLVLTNFTTRPVVRAVDANGNLDLDFTGTANNVSITNAASVRMNPGNATSITVTPVNGVIDFATLLPAFQYTDQNAGSFDGTLTLAGGGINSVSGAGFIACSPITVNYSNATTISAGTGIANISSIATGSIDVFSFTVTDDGGSGNDGAATKISAFTFTPNASNQFGDLRDLIATASLRDNSGNTQAATAINATDITFSSIPFASGLGNVADNAAKIYTLSITLKTALGGTLPATADNLKLIFDILQANVTQNATGSRIPAGQSANSGTSNGAFQVFATKLTFTTQPPANYLVNVALSDPQQGTIPVVEALDVRNNRDLDYVAPVTTTTSVVSSSNQPTTFRSNVPVGNGGIITNVAGQAFGFGNMKFTTIGAGATITVTSTTPNANSVVPTAAVSSSFEVKVGSASTFGSPVAVGPVPSTAFTAAAGGGSTGATPVFSFEVTDDANPPNDGNPTLINQITFRQNPTASINSAGLADWRHAIAGAVLSDGTNTLTLDFSSASDVTRTGTITASTGSTTVTGTGTSFTTDLSVGNIIKNSGGATIGTVATITSNTSLTLAANASVAVTNGAYRASPLTAKSIIFSAIPIGSGQLGRIDDSVLPGDSKKTYTLSIWLKSTLTAPLPITIDGLKFGFDVPDITDVVTDPTGTALASGTAVATSGNTVNVVASKINYLTLPFTSVPSLPFPSSRSIYDPFGGTIGAEAVDFNGNRDLNYTGTISAFSAANSLIFTNNPNGQAFTGGTFTFDPNFQYQTTGSSQNADGRITMTASGGANPTLSAQISPAIDVFSSTDSYVYFDPTFAAQVYSNTVNQQAAALPATDPNDGSLARLAQLILTDGEVTRTGTITTNTSSTNVTGVGTSFLTELSVGTLIKNAAGAPIGTVATIGSNTALTLTANAAIAVSGGAYKANVDADKAFTRISSITFTLTGAGTSDLRTLALYDNSGNKVSADQPASGSVTFSGLTIQAADGGINTFSIRGTFQETIGADRDPVTFQVSSVTWSAGSRFFNFTNPAFIGGINGGSATGVNQVNVVATSLDFVTQPNAYAGVNEVIDATTTVGPLFTGIVHARDKFANLDTDFNFTYALSAPAGPTPNTATTNFTNGILNLVGMKYTTTGIGTLVVTSNSLTSNNSLSGNSRPCSRVDVINVGATLNTTGLTTSTNLKGGTIGIAIFGVDITPAYFVSEFKTPTPDPANEPSLQSLTFSFDVPYRTASRTTLRNLKIFESTSGSYLASTDVSNIGGTVTALESVTGSGNFDRIRVTFSTPRPLYTSASQSSPTRSYFLTADIDVTATNNTPKITPQLLDAGYLDDDIQITEGSALASVIGTQYGFASTRPPSLVGANCVPPSGTLNVSAGITSIGLSFDVPVVTFDGVARLFDRETNTLVANLTATNGRFITGTTTGSTINTVPPVNTINFAINLVNPSNPLAADKVYYVTLPQGTFNPTAEGGKGSGQGVSDDQLNLFGGITYNGTYYFKIASNTPPKMISTDLTKYEAAATVASLNASFDQKGKGYYLILPNGSPAPTAAQVFSGTHPGKLASGNFTIDQLAPNLQYFVATGNFSGPGPYQVWLAAENDSPTPVRSGVYGKFIAVGNPNNFVAGQDGPTYTFTQPLTLPSPGVPIYQICPNSFSVLSQPILLRETAPGTWNAGSQNFNILLPPGFNYDVNYSPKISLVGSDFVDVSRTGTITANTGSATVTGVGTQFSNELSAGVVLKTTGGVTIGTISAIASNTELTLALPAAIGVTGAGFRTSGATAKFVNSTLLNIQFTNSGATTLDQLAISDMRISPLTASASGNITRFAGSGLTNYPDNTVLARISANPLTPQNFGNSYTDYNNFGASVKLTGVVTSIPDNFFDAGLNRNATKLIPIIDRSNDYNASFFSGSGVTDDVLNLSGVTKNVAFDVTMTRTDLNGCFLSRTEQYTVYDNTNIIPVLTNTTYGPSQPLVNSNFVRPGDVAIGTSSPPLLSAGRLNFNDIAGFSLDSMVLKVPLEITSSSTIPTRTSQIIFGPTWQKQLDKVLKIVETRPTTGTNKYRDYRWDYAHVLNAKNETTSEPTPIDKNPYEFFSERTPVNNQLYFTGGSLGYVDFIGKFQSTADLTVFQPLVQRIQLFVPAIPIIEVTGQSRIQPAAGANPEVYIFCEQGINVQFNGFPAASPGKSKAYYSLYDEASNTLLYDGKNPTPAMLNKGFSDNANSNGSATLVTSSETFRNDYKVIRVEYTYQDDNSPAIGTGRFFIQISPNPNPDFRTSTLCEDVAVTFTDRSTFAPVPPAPAGLTVNKWSWNFSDPNSNVVTNPNTSIAQQPVHTYEQPGLYANVLLQVTSSDNCPGISPVSKIITPTSKDIRIGATPQVDFGFVGVDVSKPITFSDNSIISTAPSEPTEDGFERLTWTLGNGTPANVVNFTPHKGVAELADADDDFSYPYPNPGIYSAKLEVRSKKGCIAERSKQIVILPRYIATSTNNYGDEGKFETSNGNWQVFGTPFRPSNTTPSWAHGTPVGKFPLPTSFGTKAWMTKLSGPYNANELSALYSPNFDTRTLQRPLVSFNSFNDLQQNDGVVLQYSTDNKNVADPTKQWQVLGKVDQGIGWYNASNIASKPGHQDVLDIGWSRGPDGKGNEGWQDSRFVLAAQGSSSVIQSENLVFRFALASNDVGQSNGFAFDNFRLGERTRTVLLESFANAGSTDPVEKAQNDSINAFKRGQPVELVKVNYRVGFPGIDPFNQDNPGDPSSRALYYNIKTTPRSRLDGFMEPEQEKPLFTNWVRDEFNKRALQLARAEMDVTVATDKGVIAVKVVVRPNEALNKRTILNIAVLEQQVNIAALGARGSLVKTGEVTFEFVVKKMLPTVLGTQTSTHKDAVNGELLPANTYTFETEWIPNLSLFYRETNDLAVAVFLQDEETREVYQSKVILNLTDPASNLVTGLENLDASQVVTFPNPADDVLYVELPAPPAVPVALELIDQMGKRVQSSQISPASRQGTLQVSGLAAGVYIVQIGTPGHPIRKKVVIAR